MWQDGVAPATGHMGSSTETPETQWAELLSTSCLQAGLTHLPPAPKESVSSMVFH